MDITVTCIGFPQQFSNKILNFGSLCARSLDGDRDSELAIGAYQPKHLCRDYRDSSPKGEVHKFRLNLFKEHLGKSPYL